MAGAPLSGSPACAADFYKVVTGQTAGTACPVIAAPSRIDPLTLPTRTARPIRAARSPRRRMSPTPPGTPHQPSSCGAAAIDATPTQEMLLRPHDGDIRAQREVEP